MSATACASGLFGLGAELDGLVQSDKCEGVRFLDPVETARREVKRLREDEQCDVVVCLSHLGISGDESDPVSDQALVRGTQGIGPRAGRTQPHLHGTSALPDERRRQGACP